MHGLELLPFKRSLWIGLVGEIRNQVSLSRSSKGPNVQYYPSVEAVTDSYGESGLEVPLTPRMWPFVSTQESRFECRATDPQERDLTWVLRPNNETQHGATAIGNEVTLTWTPSRGHVNDHLVIWNWLRSSGEYNHHGAFCEEVAFVYAVNPPRA
jgi:hypothetical protein